MLTLWMVEPVVQSIQMTASAASGALLIEDRVNEINGEFICHIHHTQKPGYVYTCVCLSACFCSAAQTDLIKHHTSLRS